MMHSPIRRLSMFRIKIKEFEIVEIRIEEGVDIGYEIKYSLFPNMLPKGGGTLSLFNVV